MKTPLVFVIAAIFLFNAPTGSASTQPVLNETTIRILLVADNLPAQQSRFADMKDFLEDAWANSQFSPLGAELVSIEFANAGVPIVKGGGSFSSDEDDAIDELHDFASSPCPAFSDFTVRECYGADVVIGMTNLASVNGFAPMDKWVKRSIFTFGNPEFIPNLVQAGLDLRGADEFYLVILDQGAGDHVMAHEFGHLLGAGHWDLTDLWLREDSHAFGFTDPFGAVHYVTAVARSATPFCSGASTCLRFRRYSDQGYSGANRKNYKTIDITASSVANYLQGKGPADGEPQPVVQCADGIDNDGDSLVDMADADCVSATDDSEYGPPPPPPLPSCDPSVAPTNLNVTRIQVCVPGTSRTAYRARWDHACPSVELVHEVWATTSGVGQYLVTETELESVVLTVEGPPANSTVRVRACFHPVFCSPFTPSVTIVDVC